MASGNIFVARPACVLKFTGEDHAEFLQGQGTADLRGGTGLCRYTLWLDHRGLIHGDGFLLALDSDAILLVSYATPAGPLKEKFERHIIADDVEIEDRTGQYVLATPTGEEAARALETAALEEPAGHAFTTSGQCHAFPGRRFKRGGTDLLLPVETTAFSGWEPLSTGEVERLRIANAVPLVPQDTSAGGTLLNPVEAALASAVSFDKGCYLGQEVVARVRRLGRLSRRLVRFSGDPPAPAPGEALTVGGKPVGAVSSVAEFPDKFLAMGWLKSRFPDGLNTFDQRTLSVETVPES
ncbi:MAG: YgfZ/GcvT domain-containing protein [Oceanipulchritudo sp.]|jgi:folate-binding protein YgfZ